jgi:hypothetical protein
MTTITDRFSPIHLVTGRDKPALVASPAFWRLLAESEDDPDTEARYRRNELQAATLVAERAGKAGVAG